MHGNLFGGIQHLELEASCKLNQCCSPSEHQSKPCFQWPKNASNSTDFSVLEMKYWSGTAISLHRWPEFCKTTMRYGFQGQAACTLAPYNEKHSLLLSLCNYCGLWAICFVVFPLPRLLCISLIPANAMGGQIFSNYFGSICDSFLFWVHPLTKIIKWSYLT